MAIKAPKRTKEHRAHFVTTSSRGPILACECGWEQKLEQISISPLHTSPFHTFFMAGFDVGRAFEQHVQTASAVEDMEEVLSGGPMRQCGRITWHAGHPYKLITTQTRYTCAGVVDKRCLVPEKHNPHPWERVMQGEPIQYYGCNGHAMWRSG